MVVVIQKMYKIKRNKSDSYMETMKEKKTKQRERKKQIYFCFVKLVCCSAVPKLAHTNTSDELLRIGRRSFAELQYCGHNFLSFFFKA